MGVESNVINQKANNRSLGKRKRNAQLDSINYLLCERLKKEDNSEKLR